MSRLIKSSASFAVDLDNIDPAGLRNFSWVSLRLALFRLEPHECLHTLSNERSPAMSDYIWVGLDVHVESITAAILERQLRTNKVKCGSDPRISA